MSPPVGNLYDIIVIGTGPVGQTAAGAATAAGLSVAAVERELVGGECGYWACIPSKAMLRPVVAIADARRVVGAREAVTGALNAATVFGRRDSYVNDWNDDEQANSLKRTGVELIRGHGRLDGLRRVAVETPVGETVTLTARHAVAICTGSRPALPELAGLDQVRPWTNREATRQRVLRPRPHGRRRGRWLSARGDLRGPRSRRADPLGDHRRGRPGASGPALACHPVLPVHQ